MFGKRYYHLILLYEDFVKTMDTFIEMFFEITISSKNISILSDLLPDIMFIEFIKNSFLLFCADLITDIENHLNDSMI